MNLVPAIKELESEVRKMRYEFERKIKPYEESIAQLRKLNDACEYCNGAGKVLRSRACAEDDAPDANDPRDWLVCDHCHGTGKCKKKES